uniref:Uncharacterized protein n=1 Tax=Arundo donax TaxID=35708 RepID=A0A0A8ZG63_ARUDO
MAPLCCQRAGARCTGGRRHGAAQLAATHRAPSLEPAAALPRCCRATAQ